ncbi:4'-phosphopantetheinyl transferase superfamily protein [Alteromonas pelagimontana]|uniref:4'-phosphopantetheinyl transferase superfamily protein n=1 Tax=Alteromonas pelagimontana TaxID=1858656 RepID=A0A6M4MEA6_9ALTE|nr:4'-phosphopantetheinyl transferase superfamily protein [Alteromonas pelagimontana]QJR80950.1 4'-phosphopantetheinyl transferase superfamily protein [Alteromonas pelagimontana]
MLKVTVISPSPSTPIAIPRDEIHVWLVDILKMQRADILGECSAMLSKDENDRLKSFRSQSRKQQFLVSRAALRSVVSCYSPEESAKSLRFTTNAHGKPELVVNPLALQFNLSHSRDKVVIGVAKRRAIGVDVEFVDRNRNTKRIADHYFHPNEWSSELLQKDVEAGNDSALRFFTLWTLKEALIKAEGKGLAIALNTFWFSLDNTLQPTLVRAKHTLAERAWSFSRRVVDEDYCVAIAYENNQEHVPTTLIMKRFVHEFCLTGGVRFKKGR